MHRCLKLAEIQHTIFSQVRDEPEGKATLAGLARTCRIFSNTALDVLWERLDSFICLVQCLPENLWRIEQTHKKMVFQRQMLLSDWEVFFRYSSRVRSLSCSYVGFRMSCSGLDTKVITTLSRPPLHGSLLPFLKILCWSDSNKEYEPLFQCLLTHCLIDVTLPDFAFCSPGMSVQLPSRCPALKRLCAVFQGFPLRPDGQEILSETVLRLPYLESLECASNILNEAAIAHLARLPSLAVLSLDLPVDLQLSNLRLHLTPVAFASLRSLELQVKKLGTLTLLLEHVRFCPGHVLFRIEDIPTAEEIHLFFTTLSNSCNVDRLVEVLLATEWTSVPVIERQRISLSTFQPLLKFHRMKRLFFDTICNFSFDDDAIAIVIEHWPNLTSLCFQMESGWGTGSSMTFQGLLKLLEDEEDLDAFALAVDLTDIDKPPSEFQTSHPSRGIVSQCQSAYFVDSPIKHPVAIAAFLSDTCPDLYEIISFWDRETPETLIHRRKWEEVEALCLHSEQ